MRSHTLKSLAVLALAGTVAGGMGIAMHSRSSTSVPIVAQEKREKSTSPPNMNETKNSEIDPVALKKSLDVLHTTQAGDGFLIRGDVDAAITEYRRALSKNGESSFAIHGLARAYERQGKYRESAEMYRRLLYHWEGKRWITSEENNSPTLMAFVLVLLHLGEREEARTIYQRGRKCAEGEIAPDLPDISSPNDMKRMAAAAHLVVYRFMKGFGNKEVAAEHLKQAVTLDPTLGPARYYMAESISSVDWRHPTKERLLAAREHYAAAAKYTKGNLKQFAQKEIETMNGRLEILYLKQSVQTNFSAVAKQP